MKPAPFEYQDPETLEETIALLAEHGDDAKVLAGGQSLIPLLNFRLARPEVLVDINRIEPLAGIDERPEGLRIGAATRQSALERSSQVAAQQPLLSEVIRYVAHAQIRNRGTVGGSIAHADPAAELPVAMTALDASIIASSGRGERRIAAEEFFVSHLTTVLEDDEVLIAVDVPHAPAGTRVAFEEFARRHGDYALGGAAVVLTIDAVGVCARARVTLLAAGDVPVRAHAAEKLLEGAVVDAAVAREAAAAAVRDIEPVSDGHGDGDYRTSVIEAMCERAVARAAVPGEGDTA